MRGLFESIADMLARGAGQPIVKSQSVHTAVCAPHIRVLSGSSRLNLLAYCSNTTKAPMAGGGTWRPTLTTHYNPSYGRRTPLRYTTLTKFISSPGVQDIRRAQVYRHRGDRVLSETTSKTIREGSCHDTDIPPQCSLPQHARHTSSLGPKHCANVHASRCPSKALSRAVTWPPPRIRPRRRLTRRSAVLECWPAKSQVTSPLPRYV
ncbi:hypothetical protein C8Q77DRAFT_828486 [Trametes polyzona]|nr:hypothetical protein C8Q77DRAFT_828486 [Trametes polyzona]